MTLYERIKQRREELHMSQDELALLLGYKSRSTIAKIESGENDITQSKIVAFAKALHTTPSYLMGWDNEPVSIKPPALAPREKGVRIPVLGKVVAGVPLEAIQEILDWEEIKPALAATGEFFALKVKGHSMEPYIMENDIVIVRKTEEVENGALAIVLVNGFEATCKKVKILDTGVTLIGLNVSVYEPHFYSCEEVEHLPVQIIGQVVEIRRSLPVK